MGAPPRPTGRRRVPNFAQAAYSSNSSSLNRKMHCLSCPACAGRARYSRFIAGRATVSSPKLRARRDLREILSVPRWDAFLLMDLLARVGTLKDGDNQIGCDARRWSAHLKLGRTNSCLPRHWQKMPDAMILLLDKRYERRQDGTGLPNSLIPVPGCIH